MLAQLREHFQRYNSLTRSFLHWDVDRNGRLSRAELAQLVDDQGVRVTEAELDELYGRMLGPDNCIRYGDFARVLAPIEENNAPQGLSIGESRPIATAPPSFPMAADRAVELLSDRLGRLARPTAAVRSWDDGHEGVIKRNRVRAALQRYNINLSEAELDAFVAGFDGASTEVIPVGSFMNRMLHVGDADPDANPAEAEGFNPYRGKRRPRPMTAGPTTSTSPPVNFDQRTLFPFFGELRRRFGDKTRRMFRYLDEDNDGIVTLDDLHKSMALRSTHEINEVWAALGNRERLEFADFVTILNRVEAGPVPSDKVLQKRPAASALPRSRSTNHIEALSGTPAFASAQERFDRARAVPEPSRASRQGYRRPNRRRSASYASRNRSSPVICDNVGCGHAYSSTPPRRPVIN